MYWEGPPIWCALRPLSKLFLENRVAVVGSSFFANFALEGLDPDNPIETLASAYTSIFPNRSDRYKADFLEKELAEFGVDGVVFHEGRTCPEHSNAQHGLEVQMRRRTGIPSLIVEADPHDLRLFSLNRLETQLRDFIELQSGWAATESRA